MLLNWAILLVRYYSEPCVHVQCVLSCAQMQNANGRFHELVAIYVKRPYKFLKPRDVNCSGSHAHLINYLKTNFNLSFRCKFFLALCLKFLHNFCFRHIDELVGSFHAATIRSSQKSQPPSWLLLRGKFQLMFFSFSRSSPNVRCERAVNIS